MNETTTKHRITAMDSEMSIHVTAWLEPALEVTVARMEAPYEQVAVDCLWVTQVDEREPTVLGMTTGTPVQTIHKVPGGQGSTWVHDDTGAVAGGVAQAMALSGAK